ncbi:MAG: outer membrane beta-barrel protein [Gemmatimonadetes bacterium]|nr:outer membrane beta-barrel protein [Gemmatimonadota bacterium]
MPFGPTSRRVPRFALLVALALLATRPARLAAQDDNKTGLRARLGASVEYSRFGSLRSVLGDVPYSTGVDAKTGTTGFAVSAGIEATRWSCGLTLHRNQVRYTQDFGSGLINTPTRVDGTMTGQFLDVSCGPRFDLGDFELDLFLGPTFANNELRLDERFLQGRTNETERGLDLWTSHGGFALRYELFDRFDLRVDAGFSGRWSKDADQQFRFGLGGQYDLGGFRFYHF